MTHYKIFSIGLCLALNTNLFGMQEGELETAKLKLSTSLQSYKSLVEESDANNVPQQSQATFISTKEKKLTDIERTHQMLKEDLDITHVNILVKFTERDYLLYNIYYNQLQYAKNNQK